MQLIVIHSHIKFSFQQYLSATEFRLKAKTSDAFLNSKVILFCSIQHQYCDKDFSYQVDINLMNCFALTFAISTVFSNLAKFIGSVVEWLRRGAYDQHGLRSKPTRATLWCFWKRHFTALSPSWWSWKTVLNYKRTAISWHLLKQVGVIAFPM